MSMKRHLVVAAALALAATAPASAEQIDIARIGLSGQIGNLDPTLQQNAPTYQYCLLDGSHPDTVGMVLCRFETLAQCMASRNSFADTCYVNPQYAGRRR